MDRMRRNLLLGIASLSVSSIAIPVKSIMARTIQTIDTTKKTQDRESDDEQIRRVLTDSQFIETLIIYVNPANFDKTLLTKYWVPENKGGKAIVQVENSVRRLLDKGWHYAKESANEQFEIRSVTIFPPGDVADVRTRERWYVPMVDKDGNIVRERDAVLEYPAVTYRLVKMDGKWLVQKSSAIYHD